MKRTTNRGRGAFTTIELLVVISIIAVLMALTTAGVIKVKTAAKRAQAGNEIGQLSTAVGNFMRDKKVDFVPSVIVLREQGNYNLADPLEVASLTYLRQVWPQLATQVDWNADGAISNMRWVLEGDQCLVFFLGGPGGTLGFTANAANPIPNGAAIGKQHFEFAANRLQTTYLPNWSPVPTPSLSAQAGFPSYVDPFGTPYAYFSSYGRKSRTLTTNYQGYSNDCPTLTGRWAPLPGFAGPYMDSATSFYQPTGHQIVSAGYEGQRQPASVADVSFGFGRGGIAANWSAADLDNVTNFSNGPLSGLK